MQDGKSKLLRERANLVVPFQKSRLSASTTDGKPCLGIPVEVKVVTDPSFIGAADRALLLQSVPVKEADFPRCPQQQRTLQPR